MKVIDYVVLRENERNATIGILLQEIALLEHQLEIALRGNVVLNELHHEAGFKPNGGNDES